MPTSKNGQFVYSQSLEGHTKGITCLTVNQGKRLLASGGEDGTKVWDLEQYSALKRPGGAGARGATTSIVWVQHLDDPENLLIFGTEYGFLVIWRRKPGHDFEEVHVTCLELYPPVNSSPDKIDIPPTIISMAFDSSNGRLAACTRRGGIHILSLQDHLLNSVTSKRIPEFLPAAVAFAKISSGDLREVLLFERETGRILTIQQDGKVVGRRFTGDRIGTAHLNSDRNYYILDVPEEGVAICRLDNDAKIRTFPVPWKRSMLPRQVQFSSLRTEDDLIISGSDHEHIYIFHRETGNIYDILDTQLNASQHLTTAAFNGKTLILIADENDGLHGNPIQIWESSTAWSSAQLRLSQWKARALSFPVITILVFLFFITYFVTTEMDLSQLPDRGEMPLTGVEDTGGAAETPSKGPSHWF